MEERKVYVKSWLMNAAEIFLNFFLAALAVSFLTAAITKDPAGAQPALLLSLLDYVPASIALAAAYERGGTIWSPIALHMLLNGMSLWALSALGGLG